MQTVLPVLKEAKGFGIYYMYDCNHPTALKNKKTLDDPIFNTFFYPACRDENTERTPTINVYQEPKFKFNPFTLLKNKKIAHQYRNSVVNRDELKDFIDRTITDFTNEIKSMEDYNFYVQDPTERNINKVILFTDKDSVTNVMKALSAEFRYKLRFYVVHATEESTH